jgi:hypothetical protein
MTPNDYVGLSVIVTPKADDLFPVYKGTIIAVREDCYKVAEDSKDELSRYIYDVDHDQLTFIEVLL